MTWESVEHISTILSAVNALGALGYQPWAVRLLRCLPRSKEPATPGPPPRLPEQPHRCAGRTVVRVETPDGHVVTIWSNHPPAVAAPNGESSLW
ncbi:hypothetical protein GCM10010425_82900 [Streptomyces spororaveus]|uniref:Uncharacterized protein n=1 Tax=Streptomyces spororaveus TaxID=284039 RepID=A0ABQ3T2Q8_9ACTN|nr:hypothetical protein Sspor_02370 [Streptomyces spororaveus]